MTTRRHRIGIGNETVPEGLRVLDAAARRFNLELIHYDWSCETCAQTGLMMPEDMLDHVSLRGLLIPIRRGFDQNVSLRLAKLLSGSKSRLADRGPADIDFMVVRENTEGEYSGVGGHVFEGTAHGFVS